MVQTATFDRQPAWRLIHTHPLGTNPLATLDPKGDLEALEVLEARTRRPDGLRAQFVGRPFGNARASASRFTDGSFPVFYAAAAQATCLAELAHHAARRAQGLPPGFMGLRMFSLHLGGAFTDLRGLGQLKRCRPLYHATDYGPAQRFALERHRAGMDGIAYDSVRDPAGTCFAVFKASSIRDLRHALFLSCRWDGTSIQV
jgi:hypothetical protein